MARFKKVPTNSSEGKITYGSDIVSDIVFLALQEIPNVELYAITPYINQARSSIKVTFEKEGVSVDVTVKTHYQQNVSEVAFKIQEAVRHNVESMTEYRIASVNVIFKGVTFDNDVNRLKDVQQPTEESPKQEG